MRTLPCLMFPVAMAFAACGDSSHAAAESGANQSGPATPNVFVSLDQEFSEPLLKRFATELGFAIEQTHDTENAKTVSLVGHISEERAHPRCSVYWNNELANTVYLAEQGLLEPYESPSAADVPAMWKDPQHRWTAFAARARILVVNTELLPDPSQWPTSYKDFVDPKWKGRCAVARPTTGTTLTHFTAMKKVLGDEAFEAWFAGMRAHDVQVLNSNGATLQAVREGQLAFAFTDTDDYHVAREKGFPVACVFPDQHEGGIGTMLIPNSVALIKNGPAPAKAKQLIDKILSRQTEALLAAGDSAQLPLRSGIPAPNDPGIKPAGAFKPMAWDIDWTAQNLARCNAEFGKRLGM